jgi:hypothetical protein
MYSAMRVIQQAAGRHPSSDMILMVIIRVTTEGYWRVAAATAIAFKILLTGPSTNMHLSAPPVMRMISKVKVITMAAEAAQSNRTRIAVLADVIESLIAIFDSCRKTGICG